MDLAVHVRVIRHLSNQIDAKAWIPWTAIVLETAVLLPLLLVKAQTDPLTIVITVVVATVITVAQWLAVRYRRHNDSPSHEASTQHHSEWSINCPDGSEPRAAQLRPATR